MPISFTRKGYVEVWRDGQRVSQHVQEREALERITEHHELVGDGEYEIRSPLVVAKAYGVLSPGESDTTAPTVPGSLSATALSATQIQIEWTQSTDNIGVTGYQVFRNGSPLQSTTELTFTDTGLTPSTQYSYEVSAFDAAGNNSANAGPALATTNANSAPVWSLGNQSYDNGQSVSITLDSFCTDADGDTINYSLSSGTLPTGLSLSGARNQTLSGTVSADGSFAFVLAASDGIAADQTVSLTFTVTTADVTAPDAPSAPTVSSFGSSTITLSLPVSAAGDHASYTVQRSTDGTNFGNRVTGITASTWQDTGLNAETAYHYRLLDVDDSGNISAAGASVSQTTSAASAGTNASRINAALGAFSIPFLGFTYPADPVTTTEATVTPATFAANDVNGRRITMSAGSYGALSISGSDKDIIISAGVTISSLTISSGSRIRVRGASPRVGTINNLALAVNGPGPSDIMLDGLNVGGGNARIYMSSTRGAIINCRLDVNTGTFAGSTFGGGTDHLLIANTEMIAPGTSDACLRFQGVVNKVFVGNHVVNNGTYGTYRLHVEQTASVSGVSLENAYVAGNQFEGTRNGFNDSATGSVPNGRLVNIWFEDNSFYLTQANDVFINSFYDSYITGNNGPISFLSLKRNAGYGPGSLWIRGWTPESEVVDNTISAWQTPPAWSFA